MTFKKVIPPSIRYKIIAPYVLVTLVLAAFGIFVVTRLVAGSFEERFKNQLKEAGAVISQEIFNQERLRLKVGRDIANTVGVSEAAAQENWQAVEDFVAPIMATNVDIDHILIIDPKGQETRRLYRDVDGYDVQFNSIIRSGANLASWLSVSQVLSDPTGKTKAVEIARDQLSGELMVYTAAPFRTEEGISGVVVVGNYLRQQLKLLKGIGAADIILFNPDGRILLSTLPLSEANQITLSQLLPPERYQEILAKREEEILFDEVKIGQQNYRLAYAPFVLQGQIRGMLGIALPTNFVTEANTLNRNVLSLIFSVGLVMILTVGFTISRQIIQPISQLVRVTRAITRGDLNRRSGITGEDEVAVLAANFDVMTAELQEKNIVLEKQAGELRAILSSIADGVIVQDLSGNILAKNPAAERILQKIGESISQDTEFERTRDPFDVFLETLGDLTFGQKRKLEIGQLVLSAVVTPVITSEGIQIGLAIVLDDITREVESERLKDKFINTTSHELKTPLTAVKGYSNVLKMLFQKSSRQLDERIYERIMDNVRRTEKQIGDLNNVVQSMLDLSEIEAEIFHVIREPIDLVEIVQTVVRQWEPKMVEKDLAFNILLPEEPIWIEGDYERLTQTFHHLIKNAYAYTLIGQVEVVVTPYDDQVQITIRDTGVGVLKEDQPYLFTRFFRAVHEESTYEVAGVGLGLYLSKAIIELHGGQIWMESKIYQGSTVQVVLPIIATPGNNV